MSPKDFKKISHPETRILNSLVKTDDTHTLGHTNMSKWRADTTRGGSAKNSPEFWMQQ